MKDEDIYVCQPYSLTNGAYKWTPLTFNIVGVILYHVCTPDSAKDEKKLGRHFRDEYMHHVLDLPAKLLLGSSRNTNAIIKAAIELWHHPVTIRHSNGTREICQIITSVIPRTAKGRIRIKVDAMSWDFLARTEHFTKYRLMTWLKLRTYYAKRLALLATGWSGPIKYRPTTLLEMFCLPDSYPVRHIGPKILAPAKMELDDHGEISFGYRLEFGTNPESGQEQIKDFIFWPCEKPGEQAWFSDPKSMIRKVKKEGLVSLLKEEEITLLLHAGFRKKGIENNIFVIYQTSIKFNLASIMKQLESEYHSLEHKGITTIENPIGYYLSRMKSMLSGKC